MLPISYTSKSEPIDKPFTQSFGLYKQFCYGQKFQRASEVTNIPFQDILCLPVEGCVKCRGRLSVHNKPANVTIFKLSGPVQGIKISLKCSACGIVCKYAQHSK